MAGASGISNKRLLEFMLEDINAYLGQDASVSSQMQRDALLAYDIYKEEIQVGLSLHHDHQSGIVVDNEARAQAQAIGGVVAEERQARQDFEQAQRMQGREPPAPDVFMNIQTQNDNPNAIQRLQHLNGHPRARNDFALDTLATPLEEAERNAGIHIAGESDDYSTLSLHPVTCISCASIRPAVWSLKAPCGHDYCSTCVATIVKKATKEEAMFPPRCCKKPFDTQEAKKHLSKSMKAILDEKTIEFTTPNRTYCSNVGCSSFIHPENIYLTHGNCPKCHNLTCVNCKNPAHNGPCLQDNNTRAVMRLGIAEGWKQCFNCSRMVELKQGCNHITCLCKAEFCYVCGVAWKQCGCATWNEEMLLEQANRFAAARANRQPAQVAAPANQHQANGVNEADVQRARDHIIQHHACEHLEWYREYVWEADGPIDCEHCGFYCNVFYFKCSTCGMQVCADCRFNEL